MKAISKGKALFILHVMIGILSLPLKPPDIIIHGLAKRCVKFSPFSWTISTKGRNSQHKK